MKRQLFLTAVLSALLLTACKNKNEEAASRVEEPYVPLERTVLPSTPPADSMTTGDFETTSPFTAAAEFATPVSEATETDEVLEPTEQTGGRTYVVQKGDTLYRLAREFYDDQSRWKDIWEANRARLQDPNKLSVGMTLIIP